MNPIEWIYSIFKSIFVWLFGPVSQDFVNHPEFIPVTTFAISILGIVVNTIVAAHNTNKASKREVEKEIREAYLTFYDPLCLLLDNLTMYLDSADGKKAELSEYAGDLQAHREKLRTVDVYCRQLEAVFESCRFSVLDDVPNLASNLGTLRNWVLQIRCLSESGTMLSGKMNTDGEMLDLMKEITASLSQEKRHLFAKDRKKGRLTSGLVSKLSKNGVTEG